MTSSPLNVVFLWHMHQPFYKDPVKGSYRLPWVRLHGTKDYLDMVGMIRDFPAVKQNYNLVPSLLQQLEDYTDGAGDVFLDVTRKRAVDLEESERLFILDNFFLANRENMIRPFPRYQELLVKRGVDPAKGRSGRLSRYFADNDLRDLQVLFNLSWIDPRFRQEDPFLKMLTEKGRNFSENDKDGLIDRQLDILKRIIPAYREMASSGRAELSFSPFYHPILPLLCDTDIARVAMPDVRLPRRFRHPEDAERQIEVGMNYFEKVFGFRPAGMWPSEGSVSEEVLSIASRRGLQWVATDEGILFNSLGRGFRDGNGRLPDPQILYRPYSFGGVDIVFRDRELSDLIGFVYSGWDPARAADDLIQRLLDIRSSLDEGPRLVSIILDGENAWEYYRNDGREFFMRLYGRLSEEERLRTVTISEFLEIYGKAERLRSLHPGSWINSNFGIWIGHEEDNLAWDYLSDARERLSEFQTKEPEADTSKAFSALYAAEGSDWNWWYGDEHVSETQEEFDELFRLNLMKVYREIGEEIPPELFEPILRRDREITPSHLIRGFINPVIDGMVTSYYEWYQGAEIRVKGSGGSMHKAAGIISAIYYGFNRDCLFVRVDPEVPFGELAEDLEISLVTVAPAEVRISCPLKKGLTDCVRSVREEEAWREAAKAGGAATGEIFEMKVPFSDLGAKAKEEIHFSLCVTRGKEELERAPWRGHITVTVPTEDFEAMMWY